MRTVGLYHRADPIAIMGAFSVLEAISNVLGALFICPTAINKRGKNDFSYMG